MGSKATLKGIQPDQQLWKTPWSSVNRTTESDTKSEGRTQSTKLGQSLCHIKTLNVLLIQTQNHRKRDQTEPREIQTETSPCGEAQYTPDPLALRGRKTKIDFQSFGLLTLHI